MALGLSDDDLDALDEHLGIGEKKPDPYAPPPAPRAAAPTPAPPAPRAAASPGPDRQPVSWWQVAKELPGALGSALTDFSEDATSLVFDPGNTLRRDYKALPPEVTVPAEAASQLYAAGPGIVYGAAENPRQFLQEQVLDPTQREYEKAYDPSLPMLTRAAHAAAGTVPFLGPALAESSEVKPAYAGEPAHLQVERAAVGWIAGLVGGKALGEHLGGSAAARGRAVGREVASEAGVPPPPPDSVVLKARPETVPTEALRAIADTAHEALANGETLAPEATAALHAAREELGSRGEPLDSRSVPSTETRESLASLGWDEERIRAATPAEAADTLRKAGIEVEEPASSAPPRPGTPEWEVAGRTLEGPPEPEPSLDDILGGVSEKESAAGEPPAPELSEPQRARLDEEARSLVRAAGDDLINLPYDTIVEHLEGEFGPQAHAAADRLLSHVADIYEGKEFQAQYDKVEAPADLQSRPPAFERDGIKQWVALVDEAGREVSDPAQARAVVSWAEDPETGKLVPAGGITEIRGEQHNLSHARSLGEHDLATSFRPIREAADALGWKEAGEQTSSGMARERYRVYNPEREAVGDERASADERSPGEAREALPQAGAQEARGEVGGESPRDAGVGAAGPAGPPELLDEALGGSDGGSDGGSPLPDGAGAPGGAEAGAAGAGSPAGPERPAASTGASRTPSLGQLPKETIPDKISRWFQDQTRRIEVAQKHWTGQGATNRKVFERFAGVRSKASYAQEIAARRYVEPIIHELGKLQAPLSDLDDYASLLHKPVRDKVIAERNPAIKEGSGWTAKAADARWAELEQKFGARDEQGRIPALEPAMGHIRALSKAALDAAVDGGLLSEKQAAALRETWGEDYVPLKTFEAEEGAEGRAGGGTGTQGFNVRGKEYQQAHGRESRADSPTAHLVQQLMRTIERAEKNKADQRFAQWITENGIAELDPKHTRYALDADGKSVEVQDQLAAMRDFTFKVDGVAHRLDIASLDPLLDRALRNMSAQQLNGFMGNVATLTRTFSQLVTSYNPEFLFRNFSRDIQDALINVGAEQGLDVAKDVTREVFTGKALREAYRATKDPFHPDAGLFREFREDGGAVGWSQQASPREIEAALKSQLGATGPGALKAGKRVVGAFVHFIEDANKAVENQTRFAVYKALRKAGIERFDAGHIARNVTLDFTKRGEAGPLLNAAYAFFNANVQGIKRLKEIAIDNPRGRKVAAALVAGGAVLDIWNRAHSGDANNDGTPDYDDIPEFIKQKNFVLMRGEGRRPLMFPMPYGFSILHTLGRKGVDVFSGAESPGKAALAVVGAAWNAFNPLGGEAGLVQTLSPTVLDPFVQHATNETWTGRPLVPPAPAHGLQKPPSEMYYKNVPPLAKEVASALNAATGGDAITPGVVSVSPEVIAHYTDAINSYLTGGAGKFAVQVGQDVLQLAQGKVPELRNIPVVRSFAYEPSPAATGMKYKQNLAELEQEELRGKAYLKGGDAAGIERAAASSTYGVAKTVRAIDKEIQRLRQLEAKGAGDLSAQIEELQTTANRLVAEAKRGTEPPPPPPPRGGGPGGLVADAGAEEAPLSSADLDELDRALGIRAQ